MQFNSIPFVLFFAFVFLLYWSVSKNSFKTQNVLLLTANCVFYGYWDWRFLSLLLGAATIDYFLAARLALTETQKTRRSFLAASLIMNLGLLFFFKYFDFFITSFAEFAELFGIHCDTFTLRLILPLGISFYTFQRLSYVIDLYKKQIPAAKSFTAFLAFSSFFPLITAGPIERAKKLVPQFEKSRVFDLQKSRDAMRQILWGLFKKIVIADNLAPLVNKAFTNYESLSGTDLAAGLFLFAIQIYSDFSGYSDIAIGISKLLGFKISRNFAYPYFSRNIGDFWRRWHISMSSWFRDYVYTPLSMNLSLSNRWKRLRNIVITFTISGLWHGSNWTFVFWGMLNGLYFIPLIFGKGDASEADDNDQKPFLPALRQFFQILATFFLTLFAWIFFRAESLAQAMNYLLRLFSGSYTVFPTESLALLYSTLLLVAEWSGREKQHTLDIAASPVLIRWSIYCAILISILIFGNFGAGEFFYAQF